MSVERQFISVDDPFRLDLTAALLRRFPSTAGAAEWIDEAYVRVIPGVDDASIVVAVRQLKADLLELRIDAPAAAVPVASVRVARMLGLTCQSSSALATADPAVARIPWLHALRSRMRGARPARYPTLWEAGVNAIVFQSVSMLAASSVLDRFVKRFGTRSSYHGVELEHFPSCAKILTLSDAMLRETGLSGAKIRAVRALATAIVAGDLAEAMLERLTTEQVCTVLCRIPGIGPGPRAVIALRALGRLDVFPLRDSGVERTIGELSGGATNAARDALSALGETRGMLYHYLLLARLEARGILLPAAELAIGCAPHGTLR